MSAMSINSLIGLELLKAHLLLSFFSRYMVIRTPESEIM